MPGLAGLAPGRTPPPIGRGAPRPPTLEPRPAALGIGRGPLMAKSAANCFLGSTTFSRTSPSRDSGSNDVSS